MKLAYAAVFVSDVEKAKVFYRDTLGLTFIKEEPESASVTFEVGATTLVLHVPSEKNRSKAQIGRSTGMIFMVDDLAKTYQDLSGKGVQFTKAPSEATAPGRVDLATFLDQDGNEIGLTDKLL